MTPSSYYWNPTRRLIANGALGQLAEVVSEFQPRRALLVLGKSSFRGSPHYRALRDAVGSASIEESPPVDHNPSIAFVEGLWQALRPSGVDLVIAVGGGSVIDCGKALRMLLAQEGRASLEEYAEKRRPFERPGLPFIAVPTTAGTGSEVTPYSSLQTKEHRKISLTHRWLFPDVAVVDPLLTHSMPPYVTACTGLDALSQAIESLWSVHHTAFSETHSVRAISLILQSFERVLDDPSDKEARFAMALASTEAGLAITQTRTTAVHAVSYPLTTFFHIPHGHACALTLPSFIRYNGPPLEPGRARTLLEALGASGWEQAAQKVERLMDRAGLERSLRKLGLDSKGIGVVIENGFRSDRVANNPREVTQEALHDILQKIY